MSALEFEGIRRAYTKGVNVLDGVSFAVEPGQVVGLLGKNGAGKTTLIRIAMGMIEPQEGSVRVLGLDPRIDPIEVKRRVGYVSEEQILPPFLTVGGIIALHRQLYPGWDDEMARDLTQRFELPTAARIRSLSKGQARRVALLCAVAHRPELLLLDEPASGLDPAARREFLETSIRLLNETGTSILFSSHYMTDVERLADRIVMVHAGGVLIDNGLDELHEGFALAMHQFASEEGFYPISAGLACWVRLVVNGYVSRVCARGMVLRDDTRSEVSRQGVPGFAVRFLDPHAAGTALLQELIGSVLAAQPQHETMVVAGAC